MKKLFLFLMFFSVLSFPSCKDNDDIYTIKYEVISNTSDAPIEVYPWGLTVKDYWSREEVSNRDCSLGFEVRCDDSDVLITLKIYVDGKLKATRDGNGWLNLSI